MSKKKDQKKRKAQALFNASNNASYLTQWVQETLFAEKDISEFEGHLDFCWKEYWKDKKYWGDNISSICRISEYAMAKYKKPLTRDDILKAKLLLRKGKSQKILIKRDQRKQKFINLLLPAASESKEKYGVPISVTLAQAIEETGWGSSVKNNNYFGVKGKGKKFTTHEIVGNKRIKLKANFRVYKSVEESVLDHGKLLSSDSRYKSVFEHKDNPFAFCDALQKAGYATETKYTQHLKSIIKGNKLYEYDGFEF